MHERRFSVPPICNLLSVCVTDQREGKSVGLLVNFLFVAIIAILPVTFQQRNLTAVELVYCAVYHIDHPVFTHLLSVYPVVLPLFQQASALLWGESGQGLNNCQTKLCQPSPQTEGWDQIDLWLKLNKWHLQQKRKKGFGRRRRRGGDQSGSGWLDASRQSKKKRNVLSVWPREKQTGKEKGEILDRD